jgi:hypothetical protein
VSSFSVSQGGKQDNGFYPEAPAGVPSIDAVADALPTGFSDHLAGQILFCAGHPMASLTDQVV